MQNSSHEDGSGGSDRVPMRDDAFHIRDVVRKAQLVSQGNRNGSKGFVDLGPTNIDGSSSGTLQRLTNGGDRNEPEHARLDRPDAHLNQSPAMSSPCSLANPSLPKIMADAALFRPDALPAVIVPCSRKAGESFANPSAVAAGWLDSSFCELSLALPTVDGHRHDLAREPSVGLTHWKPLL